VTCWCFLWWPTGGWGGTGADTTALGAVNGAWLMEWASAAGDPAGNGHGGETS